MARINAGAVSLRLTALVYLAFMLFIPLAAVFQDGFKNGAVGFCNSLFNPAAWHALKLTIWTAVVMALINAVMGTLTAYVLVRYSFPGRAWMNSLIDLPFAIPTLVTGVMLVILYGPQQVLGSWLKNHWGWEIIFAPTGIILALLFVTFPLVRAHGGASSHGNRRGPGRGGARLGSFVMDDILESSFSRHTAGHYKRDSSHLFPRARRIRFRGGGGREYPVQVSNRGRLCLGRTGIPKPSGRQRHVRAAGGRIIFCHFTGGLV